MMKYIIILCFILRAEGLSKYRIRNSNERIIGGTDARSGEFPHQVSLQIKVDGKINYRHICGGSIISKMWIVTAAHCYLDLFGAKYRVVAGINDIGDLEEAQIRKVVDIVVHPKYRRSRKPSPNDIAVMKVERPFKFSHKVRPIDLPSEDEKFYGDAVLSGWGSTSTSSLPDYPDILQTVTLPLISDSECRRAWKKLESKSILYLTSANVCTGPTPDGEGSCSGDSGGPLIKGNILIGIVSWGRIPCGYRGAPSVFTEVSKFVDFINSNLEDFQKKK